MQATPISSASEGHLCAPQQQPYWRVWPSAESVVAEERHGTLETLDTAYYDDPPTSPRDPVLNFFSIPPIGSSSHQSLPSYHSKGSDLGRYEEEAREQSWNVGTWQHLDDYYRQLFRQPPRPFVPPPMPGDVPSTQQQPLLQQLKPRSSEAPQKVKSSINVLRDEFQVAFPADILTDATVLFQRADVQLPVVSSARDGVGTGEFVDGKETLDNSLHPTGCKPCAFRWTKGCANGDDCPFCHEWHPPRKKKPMRDQKNLMIIARRYGKIEFLRCSLAEALQQF